MIEIRPEQLAALDDDRTASLPRRIARYLVDTFPEKASALRPRQLDELVAAAIERAHAHGIDIEWDVCRFALLRLELGPDFEHAPWATEILTDHELSPTARMDELEYVWANYLR